MGAAQSRRLAALAREIPEAVVVPQAKRSLLVIYGNENRPTTITGVDNNFFEARDWKLAAGGVGAGPPFSPDVALG